MEPLYPRASVYGMLIASTGSMRTLRAAVPVRRSLLSSLELPMFPPRLPTRQSTARHHPGLPPLDDSAVEQSAKKRSAFRRIGLERNGWLRFNRPSFNNGERIIDNQTECCVCTDDFSGSIARFAQNGRPFFWPMRIGGEEMG